MNDMKLTQVNLEKNGRPITITVYKDWKIEIWGALKVNVFIDIGGENGLRCPAVINVSVRKKEGPGEDGTDFAVNVTVATKYTRFELIRLLGEHGTSELVIEAGEQFFGKARARVGGVYHNEPGQPKKISEEIFH